MLRGVTLALKLKRVTGTLSWSYAAEPAHTLCYPRGPCPRRETQGAGTKVFAAGRGEKVRAVGPDAAVERVVLHALHKRGHQRAHVQRVFAKHLLPAPNPSAAKRRGRARCPNLGAAP